MVGTGGASASALHKTVISGLCRVGMGCPGSVVASQGPSCGTGWDPVLGRWHSLQQEGIPFLVDIDGVHVHVQGALLVLHRQVVLPQGHTVGPGVAGQRKQTRSRWPSALPAEGQRGAQGHVDPAL